MRKEGFNKIRALLTVICMLAGMLVTVGMPTKVYAVDAPWEGSGTEQNPYKISAAVELISVRDAVYSQYLGAYFVQTADIDLSGVENWEPIGTYDNPFTGNFDGKGHTILNIAINRPSSNEQGLFGFISGGGKLKDLHIEGAHVTGGVNVGILAGIIAEANGTTGNGTIENCSTSGTVNGTARIGGLIGSVQNGGAIVTGSFSMAAVTATGTSYSGSAGGLAGFLISGGTIQDSYATGTVHGYYAGGLVGDMNDSGSTIERSYAAGAVTGSNKSGGLVGNKGTGSVNDSFFDSVATGQSGSAGGTAKNTDKMQQQSTFTNWDFSSIWNISEDATYPFLRWQVTFAVTYDINGGTGTPPAASEVPAGVPFTTASTGSLTAPKGMQLKEWNTNADGTGTGYAAGATVTMPANDLSLYAIWEVSIIFDTPDTVIFGEPFDITVRVVDIYGDPVTDYTGTIVFKGAGNQPGLPETYTFTESDHGEKTFSDVVINYFGPFTLSVYEQSNQPDYYWEFDEGTGTATVDSVNDTSGTLYNTDSGVWVSGTPETNFTNPYAIKLDGSDDYIDAGTVDLANQSFTIAFWAKRSRGGQEWLISQGTGSTNQVLHIGFRSDSEFSFAFWGNDLNITALSYDTDWHHWTVTYDAATKTQKVFQDGSLLDTHQTTSDLISTGSLLIGKRFDGYHYGGSIDDLQVYLRALSPTEIETLADGNRSFLSASKVINIDASGQIPSLQLNMPQSVKAGEAFAAELTALDSEGGIINSINGPIPIYWSWDATTSPNGSNPVLAAAQANFSNGIASVDGFIPCKAGETITLTAEIAGTDARSSGTALVLPGRPWKLSIQKPAVMYMEKPFAVTVSILDRFENIVSDYIGKIALSGSDPGARLPEAYTFTESDLGVKEFSNIIFNEPGSFDLRAADISGELLGYWSFDEGQGNIVYDLSTNEKHGTGYNLGSGAWTSGPSAIQFNNPSAIQFDGSRYIVTPEGIDLANQPFTIAFWAKRSGVNNGWIVSQGIPETDQGLQIGLLYGGSSYKTKFVVDFYADGGNTAVAEDYGWHHWAVTYDPSTKRQTLYRDGVLLVSTTTNGNLQSSGPLLIGMRFDYGGFENYQGSLDDLRVYRQVLTKEYIEAMAAGHAEILYGKEVVAITPVAGALLDPSGTVYDLSAPGDISTTITWVSGESLEGIMNGEVPLQMGQDYTLSGDLLVISESYLSGLNQEEDQQISLSLRFDAGVDAVFTISIIDSSTYALTYDANGAAGTIPSGSNKVPGATFSAAAADSLIAPQGKQFKEWNTEYDRTGTGYLSGAIVTMPAKDLILYAIWEDIPGSTPSHIYFGNNGGSPILWRILEDNETEMFLLSEGALAWIKFDPDYDSIYDYGISIPRNWLAGDFLNSFTLKEQEAIRPQRVFDANNVATAVAEYAEGGDKFFLLSRDEALNATYFPGGDADRVLAPGALSDDWWLRTPKGNGFVYTVFYGGNIGEIYFYNSSWVRPAFKLNKES
ncbi:MAG: LamG-like jellyroll fold domain-containing protein, partial [Dehalobacterium sp.]